MNKLTLLALSSETTSGHSVRYDVKISGGGGLSMCSLHRFSHVKLCETNIQ